jgi:hypothetical protein
MLLSTLTEESSANVAQVWNPANLAALVAVMTAHPGQSTLQHFGLSCLQVGACTHTWFASLHPLSYGSSSRSLRPSPLSLLL